MLPIEYLERILQGYKVTIGLTFSACLFATFFAVLICLMRMSRFYPLLAVAKGYVSVFRNTPLLVQLFFWYNGVSRFLPRELKLWLLAPHEWWLGPITIGFPSNEFIYGFMGLGFYTSAYIAEELRAGIQTVPENQKTAALALGFRPTQAFLTIILPQALANALSPLFGQYMNAVKNSSLATAIGVTEMMYVAQQIDSEAALAIEVYAVITVLYIATIILLEFILNRMQKRRLRRLTGGKMTGRAA